MKDVLPNMQADEPQVDVEATITNILDRVLRSRFNSINEPKLRAEIKKDPNFLLEAAKFAQAEVVYQK